MTSRREPLARSRSSAPPERLRLAILCDFVEEGWPSMDLAAEMLLRELPATQAAHIAATRICPPLRRRASVLPGVGASKLARNADRLCNRLWDYPRHVRRLRQTYDAYHVVDHTYAGLVHSLPPDRTGVFCHDLDAFRCLLEPKHERRPRWFRAQARYALRGLQRAAVVFCSTAAMRAQIERSALVDAARLVVAPYGVAPEFTAEAAGPDPAATLLGELAGAPFLLHVGSCIPRKRIDVLLGVFAQLRSRQPGLRLVQVGGVWTAAQKTELRRLGIDAGVSQWRGLSRGELASLYRQAALVLQPSESEGFGLPVVEALACGARVIASDLPVLREVGGEAVVYAAMGHVPCWVQTAGQLLGEPARGPVRAQRLARAATFSWARHARTIFAAYGEILQCTSDPGWVS